VFSFPVPFAFHVIYKVSIHLFDSGEGLEIFEINVVEHCGGPKTDGDFVDTLTLADITSGWTECVTCRTRKRNRLGEFTKVYSSAG
jgi:hypothetical protein